MKRFIKSILIILLVVCIISLCLSTYIHINIVLENLKRWKETHQPLKLYKALWSLTLGDPVGCEILLYNLYTIISISLLSIAIKKQDFLKK